MTNRRPLLVRASRGPLMAADFTLVHKQGPMASPASCCCVTCSCARPVHARADVRARPAVRTRRTARRIRHRPDGAVRCYRLRGRRPGGDAGRRRANAQLAGAKPAGCHRDLLRGLGQRPVRAAARAGRDQRSVCNGSFALHFPRPLWTTSALILAVYGRQRAQMPEVHARRAADPNVRCRRSHHAAGIRMPNRRASAYHSPNNRHQSANGDLKT